MAPWNKQRGKGEPMKILLKLPLKNHCSVTICLMQLWRRCRPAPSRTTDTALAVMISDLWCWQGFYLLKTSISVVGEPAHLPSLKPGGQRVLKMRLGVLEPSCPTPEEPSTLHQFQ